MQLSPAIMNKLSTVEIAVDASSYWRDQGKPLTRKVYQFKGTLSEYFEWARLVRAETRRHENEGGWTGLGDQSVGDFHAQSVSTEAHRQFTAAMAHLNVKAGPSLPEFRVTGGVWSVPRYLTGHPAAAIHRPRTKLPPQNWEVSLSVSASVKAEGIATSMARIARAAWDYTQRGGTVTLTAHYLLGFIAGKTPDGHEGIIFSIRVPLADVAAFATSLSLPLFRASMLQTGLSLSPRPTDDGGLPWAFARPTVIHLQGRPDKDRLALKKMGIV